MDGMAWDDVRALIRRNQLPWRYVHYYRSKQGFIDTISIVDFSFPKRSGALQHTADGHEKDWYRDSFVCNAGFVDGYIPYEDNPSVWHEVAKRWVVRPMRGLRSTLRILVKEKVVENSEEIKNIIR